MSKKQKTSLIKARMFLCCAALLLALFLPGTAPVVSHAEEEHVHTADCYPGATAHVHEGNRDEGGACYNPYKSYDYCSDTDLTVCDTDSWTGYCNSCGEYGMECSYIYYTCWYGHENAYGYSYNCSCGYTFEHTPSSCGEETDAYYKTKCGKEEGVYYNADGTEAEPSCPESHECSLECYERLHKHTENLDETVYMYTCDSTETYTEVWYNTDITKAEMEAAGWDCGHKGYYYETCYYCEACGEYLYMTRYYGCKTSSCGNYYNNSANPHYKKESHPGSHSYGHAGTRYTCTNSTSHNEIKWEMSSGDLCENRCSVCGELLYYYSAGYDTVSMEYGFYTKNTYKSGEVPAYHYYYVKEPLEGGCYSFGEAHADTNPYNYTTTRTEEECYEHGSYDDVYRDYNCDVCGLALFYRDSIDCSGCGYRETDESYYRFIHNGTYEGFSYVHPVGEWIGNPYYYNISDRYTLNKAAMHRTQTLTCTEIEYGEKICDKVVVSLIPEEAEQIIISADEINTAATAVFMNNVRTTVECAYSGFDAAKYNEWQTVTLSYGEYSAADSKAPQTATIQVYLECVDFDVTTVLEDSTHGTVSGGGTYTAGTSVTVGASASTGYEFEGWYDGEDKVSGEGSYTFTMPARNLTLTARFTPKTYLLNVYSEAPALGTVTAAGSAPYHSSVTVKAIPAGGFVFDGWYDAEDEWKSSDAEYTFTMPAFDYTLRARFGTQKYTIFFDAAGGEPCDSIKAAYLGMYGELPVPVRDGYVFLGWQYNGSMVTGSSVVMVKGDHTLTAVWIESIPDFILVNYGAEYQDNSYGELPTPSKTGYSFLNWYLTENALGNGDSLGEEANIVYPYTVMNIPNNHTIHAGWKEKTYTLSFDSNGGSACGSMPITYDRAYGYHASLSVPEKEGYTFAGWWSSSVDGNGVGTLIEDKTRVQAVADQTVYAKWTKDKVKVVVTFNPRTREQVGLTAEESKLSGYGSTIGTLTGANTREVTYPGTYGADFPVPIRTGYSFAYWKYEDTILKENMETLAAFNHTVYAVYTPKEYSVTLDGQSATTQPQSTVTVTFDAVVPDIAVPSRTSYTFMGYFTGTNGTGTQYYDKAGKGLLSYETDGDITLYACWEKDTVITYHANGGTGTMTPTYLKHGETTAALSPVTFTKTGYFTDARYTWNALENGTGTSYADGETVTGISSDMTLYAQWKPVPYYVSYADDEISVSYEFSEKETWYYDTAYEIKDKPFEKHHTLAYDLNRSAGMSENPVMQTAASDIPYRAEYPFAGWRLYDKTGTSVSNPAALFTPGQKAKNLTTTANVEFALVPEWEERADKVVLPEAGCRGYTFRGWALSGMETNVSRIYNGDYVPAKNTVLYAIWTPVTSLVSLDDRGATSGNYTKEVEMTFDAAGPDITVPEKTGYTFGGYFTGTRGTGMMYYNTDGTCVRNWTEEGITVLYAFWLQNGVEYPEIGDRTEPTPLPELDLEGSVGRTDAKGLLYADDYNPDTGALDDLQPYLTYDIKDSDGNLISEGAVPGTEKVSFRAKMGAWMLQYKFHRYTGTDYVRVSVTVPYRTQYELENEELVISERQTGTYEFTVPKVWSYWAVTESGMYYPDKVTVTNSALKDGTLFVDVVRDSADAVEAPSYEAKRYGGKEAHVFWPEYDAEGIPVFRIILTDEQYIISEKTGTPPDVDAYLSIVCGNAAWEDAGQATVKSDKYVFDGIEILSDAENSDGNGSELEAALLPSGPDAVEQTSYLQNYASGIELDELKPNGTYETSAVITYTGDAANVGTPARIERNITDINALKLHTPVACDGVVVDGMEEEADGYTLVLKEALNFFTLRIDNTGTHRMSLGYGTKDFSYALSGKSNVAEQDGSLLNQVQFPFDVYLDVGNNSRNADGTYSTEGDMYFTAGTWLTVGKEEQCFYLPVTQKNGKYQINFRTTAVNCPVCTQEEKLVQNISEKSVNIDPAKYVVTDGVSIEIKSYLRDFILTDTNDADARKQLNSGSQALTLKKGYGFSYEVLTQGAFYGEYSEINITPNYFWVSANGEERIHAVLYRCDSLLNNEWKMDYSWEGVPLLKSHENYEVILQSWGGEGFLPENILCVAAETEEEYQAVEEYIAVQTITGRESFFKRSGYLVINFDVKVKSAEGEWYTFSNWMSTELAKDALAAGWNYYPGDIIRYDLSKGISDDYEVGGVE